VSRGNAGGGLPDVARRSSTATSRRGESAIWIWAPIITTSVRVRELAELPPKSSDCEYDDATRGWSEGLVGFKPAPVFDISPQTEGEPLPDLDTEATGDAGDLVGQLSRRLG